MERGLAILEPVDAEHNKSAQPAVEVSVVIPISERHDDLQKLYLEYAREISACGVSAEFIFVLDGLDLEVLRVLKILKKDHPDVSVVTLNRSFGEATALSAGFQKAKGKIIVTIAAYFQVEPYELRRMLEEVFQDKQDLVVVWRNPRIDPLLNRLQARVYHWIVQAMIGTKYHDVSCGLRVMKRVVAEEVSLYGDLHRFFPIAAYQKGFRVAEMSVRQSLLDAKGRTQSPGVYLRRLLDILTFFFLFKFTKKPLRFFGLVGSGIFAAGAIITGYLWLERLFGVPLAGRPLLILGVLLMVFGVQLFSTGLLGEIIIFTHARDLRDYQMREVLD